MDDTETALKLAFQRLKGLITQTEYEGFGLRINEADDGIESVTLYEDVLVLHVRYEDNTYEIEGRDFADEKIYEEVKEVHEVAEIVESILFR